MTGSDQQRTEELFFTASELPHDQRGAFLDKACAGDAALRTEIESLLAHDLDQADAFSEGRGGIAGQLMGSSADDAPIPERIGRYRILHCIGAGGMGVVYAAEQDHPKRRIALKTIRPGVLSASLLRRFQFEADSLGRLQHPGIAQIYEAGAITTSHGRVPYFAMEFVDGLELRSYAKQHDLETPARLELVARICDAVHHAHQKGIIHRDLKPDNVLVVEEARRTGVSSSALFASLGQPKVLDFGVARATDSDILITTMHTDVGKLIGTLPYMSPEQISGESQDLDTRSDIYALGVILYELLTNRLPFDLKHKAIPEAARIVREEQPTRLSSIESVFRGDIETIVGKALHRDRERRYQSAVEMAADIRRHLAHEPIAARPPSAVYQISRFARRHRGLVLGLALAFVILVAGTITSVALAIRASQGMRLATEKEAEARRTTTRLNVKVAEADADTDPVRARLYLDDVPLEARGWEWRHIRARLDAHVAEYTAAPDGSWRRREGLSRCATTTICRGDGALLTVFARRGGLEVVNLISGKVEHTVGYPAALSWPELSPDGRRLSALSAGEEKLIVWDLATGDRILDLPISVSGLKDVCFSPDGRHLAIASVSTEGSKVVDLDTGRSRWFIQPGGMSAWSIAFSPEGDRLVVAVGWQAAGHLRVFSLSGEPLASRHLPRDEYNAMAFSPDGRRLAVGQKERTIRVFDAATLEELHVLHGHNGAVTALAFLPDGQRLASGSADGTIRLWNLETGSAERVITGLPPHCPPSSLAFTPDGAMLAAGGVSGTRLWALERGARVIIEAHDTYVYGVAFSPDGQTIVSAPFTGNVHLFNALDGTKLAELPSEMPFRLLAYTPDGARLLIHNEDLDQKASTLFAWDPAAGVRLTTPRRESDRVFFRHREDARDARLASFLAVRGGTRSAPMSVYSVALSADRSLVAYASGTYNAHASEDEILILNTATGETISRFGKQMGKIYSIALSSDARRVVSGDGNGTLNVWDLATETLVATMTEHTGVVLSIAYSPDGSRIASAGNDGSIILWNAETFENVLILRGHRSYVHSVSFSDDGTMIASASGDGTVRIWDSVRPAERWRQSQRADALRPEAESVVDRLMSRFTDPLDVADEIRGDAALGDNLRRVALSVLLQRSPVATSPLP